MSGDARIHVYNFESAASRGSVKWEFRWDANKNNSNDKNPRRWWPTTPYYISVHILHFFFVFCMYNVGIYVYLAGVCDVRLLSSG